MPTLAISLDFRYTSRTMPDIERNSHSMDRVGRRRLESSSPRRACSNATSCPA